MKQQHHGYHSAREPNYDHDGDLHEYKLRTPYSGPYRVHKTDRQVEVVKTKGCCSGNSKKQKYPSRPPPPPAQPSYRTTNRVTKRSTNQVGNSHYVRRSADVEHHMDAHERSHKRLDPNDRNLYRYGNKNYQHVRQRQTDVSPSHYNYHDYQQVHTAHKRDSKCCCTIL
ncbi:unnamed protein product [Didymodactylos carnosus]|uniref:Uncharacterized protein n=1 Tax=Didymodactylos carnosus TaxID=1234261 RepID=A0A814GVR3_9BILA|nr:unnamed protein product [Didymodactylos carnosus]CAF1001610.1 unnamed protein product [Didymodactylos carnosus]CAF3639610.1 unnamed protein product [Didymodactylos carnosus]CAF3772970.1 unnamed protein product [Didymodactylos carnosus]